LFFVWFAPQEYVSIYSTRRLLLLWPLQDIRLVRGLCPRINTTIRKHPPCLGTPSPPCILLTIARYSVSKPGGGNVTDRESNPRPVGASSGDSTTHLKRSAVMSGTGIHRLIYRDICVERAASYPACCSQHSVYPRPSCIAIHAI